MIDNQTAQAEPIDIDANRRLLNRYRYVEHETLRILSGWLPRAARFELKCEMGRAIWEDAQHVNALYLRLREIQSPAFQDPADKALIRLMKELLDSPDEVALSVALWRVVKPALMAALRIHENATFPNSDQPSVYAIEHILLDETRQIERIETVLRTMQDEGLFPASVGPWEAHVRALLRDAGGIGGDDARPASPQPESPWRRGFTPPLEVARDSRFPNLGSRIENRTVPGEDSYSEHTSFEFESYSTEMLAAETVASVMFRLPGMPWGFVHDSARHLYDEVRHCLMGYEWMQRHGLDPFRCPQNIKIYQWRSQFPPVEQYCLLTMGNEAHAFPYRHRRVEEHRAHGDPLSEQFVRYDIADETQHVRFGNRWLPEMLKVAGEERPLEKFVADVLEVWNGEYKTGRLSLNIE